MAHMRWDAIKKVTINKTDKKLVPVRMKLIYHHGGEVTSAGWSVSEAAITLFSTAGLGRHSPNALIEIIKNRFSTRLSEDWINELICGLFYSLNAA